MTGLLEFADQCGRFGATQKATQVVALKAAAEATKAGITTSAMARGWPTRKSGMGPIGFTSRSLGGAVEVRARGGAAYAFEYGAKRHVIVPRGSSAGPRARRNAAGRGERLSKVLKTPYGPRAYVEHPGFRGRPYWEPGLRLAEPEVVRAMEAGVVGALRRTFH